MNKKPKKKFNIKTELPTVDDSTKVKEANKLEIDNYTRVKHLANLGDMISIMPCLKKYHQVTGRKIVLCQQINTLAAYYAGATHPTVDEEGRQVCINNAMFEMVKPLIESQEYIQRLEVYNGQPINLDFDVIRGKTFVNMPQGMIQSWTMFAYPDLAYDLSQPWISLPAKKIPSIEKQIKGKILINFTERYRNELMDYFFLKKYAPNLVFAGTEREHFLFCTRWELNIPRLEVNNFLELAYAIKMARFVLCNQSFIWNIAQATHAPRILELCRFAANCMPFVGKDSYGYYHQIGLEYYFRTMFDRT